MKTKTILILLFSVLLIQESCILRKTLNTNSFLKKIENVHIVSNNLICNIDKKDSLIIVDKNIRDPRMFVTTLTKALYIGSCHSDMLYFKEMNKLNEFEKVFKNYGMIMADLGHSNRGYEIRQLLESKTLNQVSVEYLNNCYKSDIKFFKDNERSGIIAFILAGEWIEKYYITNKAAQLKEDEKLVRKNIKSQKKHLDNIIEIIETIDNKITGFEDIQQRLIEILNIIIEVDKSKKESLEYNNKLKELNNKVAVFRDIN